MIERLYVQNYRCLENFTLKLSGTPSALLIGRNGSGKSTLRQGLSLFQRICRESSRVRNLVGPRDFSYGRTDRPMRFEIDMVLSGRHHSYSISFEWPENFREARVLEEKHSVDGEEVFSREHSQVRVEGGAEFGVDWHVVALPIVNARPRASSRDEIRSFFSNMMLISPNPSLITGSSDEPTLELRDDCANFASCLRALLGYKPAAYGVVESYLRSRFPDFSSIEIVERGEMGTQLVVEFAKEDGRTSFKVDFKDLSDGEKCTFIGALVIAFNSVAGPVFCMWDEPDNHLALSEIGQFVTTMRKMARQRGQFVATSHHPETIRKFSDENTLVLTRESHLDPTVVRELSEFNYTGDLVSALIRDEIIG